MLENGDCGPLELHHQFRRTLDVEDVSVAEVLALELLKEVVEGAVEIRLLVRVLAIAQALTKRHRHTEAALRLLLLVEEAGDSTVVGRRALIDFNSQPLARRQRGRAVVLLHLLQHHGVIRRIGDDGDALIILRCSPQHGRPADVYVFDRLLQRHPFLCDRFLEWIEIHHHQINGRHLQLLRAGHMLVVLPLIKKSAVDLRVQCLHAAIEALRVAGIVRHFHHRQIKLAQELRAAAGGDQFHAEGVQAAGEGLQA